MLNIPQTIQAGDTLGWKDALPGFPASQGWSLTFSLRGPAAHDIPASTDGDGFSVLVPAAETAQYSPGLYGWTAKVSHADGRTYTVETGRLTILADLAASSEPIDPRTDSRRVLDAINAVIEKRASIDQQSMTVNGRSLQRTPLPDLLRLKSHFENIVATEERAEKIRKGQDPGGRILVRFAP